MASKAQFIAFNPRSPEAVAGLAALKASKASLACACRTSKGTRCTRAATTSMPYKDSLRGVNVEVPCCTQHARICQPAQEVVRTLPATTPRFSASASSTPSETSSASYASSAASGSSADFDEDDDMSGLSARMRAVKLADSERRAQAEAAYRARNARKPKWYETLPEGSRYREYDEAQHARCVSSHSSDAERAACKSRYDSRMETYATLLNKHCARRGVPCLNDAALLKAIRSLDRGTLPAAWDRREAELYEEFP
jgi:hypothetical protein